MMTRVLRLLLAALAILPEVSCVREFPGVNPDGTVGVDPTLVSVNLDLTFDMSLESLAVSHHSRSGDEMMMRVIVEFTRGGIVAEKAEAYIDPAVESGKIVNLPLAVKLHALEYNVAVWAGYVSGPDHEPLCFDVSEMYSVTCMEPYRGSVSARQCFCGVASMDLRDLRDRWNVGVTVPVELRRPQAKYRIIATDVDKLLSRGVKARGRHGGYKVRFGCDVMPWSYDVWSAAVAGYRTGVEYTLPLDLPELSDGTLELGFDWLFAGDETEDMTLSLTVFDEYLIPVSHVTGIVVPLRRGRLTTVAGDFLTNEVGGAITIDTEWGGTIDIEVDIE